MYHNKMVLFLLCSCVSFAHENKFNFTVTNTNTNTTINDLKTEKHKIKKIANQPLQQPTPESPLALPIPKESCLQQVKRACSDHPYITTAGILVTACYLTTLSSLYGIKYICYNRCKWAFWHDELSSAQLQKCDSEDVAKALFATIAAVYEKEQQQEDNITSLLHCIDDLDRELTWHRYFLSITQWLEKTGLAILFPEQETTVATITEQKERLIVLRRICVTWLHRYTHNGATYA